MVKTNKGFTLIELLVVIAIIGLLSSVVLASLNSARQKARDARRVADLKQIQTAMELYYDTCKQYPATLATTANNCTGATATFGTYLSTIPKDPGTGSDYMYGTAAVNSVANMTYCAAANMEGNPPVPFASQPACTGITLTGLDTTSSPPKGYKVAP